MGEALQSVRVVLDTNTVISALLFTEGRLSWIRELWTQHLFVLLCSRRTSEELVRVLAYPKFHLDAEEVESLLASYLVFAEVVEIAPERIVSLPRCRDEKDQIFLEAAQCGSAEVLVTGDQDLIALTGRVPFAIETPARFKVRCEEARP